MKEKAKNFEEFVNETKDDKYGKFKVGDKIEFVKCTKNMDCNNFKTGDKGIIIEIVRNWHKYGDPNRKQNGPILVEWERKLRTVMYRHMDKNENIYAMYPDEIKLI
jgi:hypothetical protein